MEKIEFYNSKNKEGELPNRINVVLKWINREGIQGNKYLDIGCYTGKITNIIAEKIKAKEIFGIDISENALKKAKKLGIKTYNLDVDKDKLPFEDNYFDVITMFEVIEHLFDPDHALEEIYRVLKPNGWFILSTPNLSYWLNRIIFPLGYKPYGVELSTKYVLGEPGGIKKIDMAGHIRVFPLKALKQILNLYKFKIMKILPSKVITKNKIIRIIDTFLIKISPSFSQVVIVFSKK